jgi:hypothetical protein
VRVGVGGDVQNEAKVEDEVKRQRTPTQNVINHQQLAIITWQQCNLPPQYDGAFVDIKWGKNHEVLMEGKGERHSEG